MNSSTCRWRGMAIHEYVKTHTHTEKREKIVASIWPCMNHWLSLYGHT